MNNLTDLNDIRAFAAAARTGSLSAAASELGQPPSTVSRAVSRLEKDLGVLLVRRGVRGLTLTDDGHAYLPSCKRALRSLEEGSARVQAQRANPSGLLKVGCPVTFARDIIAPLLPAFLGAYPELNLAVEAYSGDWDQEPRQDCDVFFKVRAPRDSQRRVRAFPGAARGLFASLEYVRRAGSPKSPEELPAHSCSGSGVWKLTKGSKSHAAVLRFRVETSDPYVHLEFVRQGLGIAALPWYMAKWPESLKLVVPVLSPWKPEPIVLCALYTGHSRLTPKVHAWLEFLAKYIGSDRDPRLRMTKADGMFTDRSLPETFSP